MPATHLAKLRKRINSIRNAIKMQAAASKAIATKKPSDEAPKPFKATAKFNVKAKVPSRFAPKRPLPRTKVVRPHAVEPSDAALSEPADVSTAMLANVPLPAGDDAAPHPLPAPVASPPPRRPTASSPPQSARAASLRRVSCSPPNPAEEAVPVAEPAASTGDVVEDSFVALLNTADMAVLVQLPQIGKKRAEQILAERAEKTFAAASDLSRIGLSGKQSAKLLKAFATAVAGGKLAVAAANACSM